MFYSFDLVCAIFYNFTVKICNDYGLFCLVSLSSIFIFIPKFFTGNSLEAWGEN